MHSRSQFLTTAAEHWLLEQESKLCVRFVNERVRSRDIVIGDVVPNLDQIFGSAGTLENDGHLCFGGAGLGGPLRPPLALDRLTIPGRSRATAQTLLNLLS